MIQKLLLTTIAMFLLTACSSSETKEESPQPIVNKQEIKQVKASKEENRTQKESVTKSDLKQSILTLKTLDGKEIHVDEAEAGLTFQEYKNKTVFVIFFGYRCPPCLQEMPNLIALMEKKYPDLEIIALEVQGLNSKRLKAFKATKGINYTLAVGRENNQFISYIAQKAQWGGSIPFFIAFDKKGEVKIVHIGALSEQQLNTVYTEMK